MPTALEIGLGPSLERPQNEALITVRLESKPISGVFQMELGLETEIPKSPIVIYRSPIFNTNMARRSPHIGVHIPGRVR